jgi:hypothetical protein
MNEQELMLSGGLAEAQIPPPIEIGVYRHLESPSLSITKAFEMLSLEHTEEHVECLLGREEVASSFALDYSRSASQETLQEMVKMLNSPVVDYTMQLFDAKVKSVTASDKIRLVCDAKSNPVVQKVVEMFNAKIVDVLIPGNFPRTKRMNRRYE